MSRLQHLEGGGVVERRTGPRPNATEYVLTGAGRDLKCVIELLGAWGVRWAFGEPKPEELDPVLLLWKIHQRIHRHLLPPGRTVVEFDLTGPRGRRLWLVLKRDEVSLCLKPPGFDSDLIVHAAVATLYRLWVGQIDYDAAVRCRGIVVEGQRHLARALPRWFMWSPMSRFVGPEREQHVAHA